MSQLRDPLCIISSFSLVSDSAKKSSGSGPRPPTLPPLTVRPSNTFAGLCPWYSRTPAAISPGVRGRCGLQRGADRVSRGAGRRGPRAAVIPRSTPGRRRRGPLPSTRSQRRRMGSERRAYRRRSDPRASIRPAVFIRPRSMSSTSSRGVHDTPPPGRRPSSR